jgi:MscS family membrane protein
VSTPNGHLPAANIQDGLGRRSFICRGVRIVGAAALALGLAAAALEAQTVPARTQAAGSAEAEPWTDPLGRSTPRGTVVGFLAAARGGDNAKAAQYLNTRPRGAEELAHKLFVVLDARLPARLPRISDAREGSTPQTPGVETIATIEDSTGRADVVVEQVKRAGDPGPIWLFSQETLGLVPAQYEEIATGGWHGRVPDVLLTTRVGGFHLVDLLAILLGLPLMYLLLRTVNYALRIGMRRYSRDPASRNVLPPAARVLLVIAFASWLVARLPLSLAVRQIWFHVATLLTTAAIARLLMLLTAEAERHVHARIAPSQAAAAGSLLRVLRRAGDVLIIFAAFIVTLRQFGIDATPALAGLGVGGIAVALAAQKTLENVIAGASLVFDKAVRVGDALKMGDVQGTVDHIGLRSTRIRTLDRTVVSVPNGQIANVSLETLSARDKYWFHPLVGLRYETTPEQLHAVVDGLRKVLSDHPLVDLESLRVRFVRLGAFSMDVDVFAYLHARDWNHFLEIQEQLLFEVTEIISRSGTALAFPSQTMYLAGTAAPEPLAGSLPVR